MVVYLWLRMLARRFFAACGTFVLDVGSEILWRARAKLSAPPVAQQIAESPLNDQGEPIPTNPHFPTPSQLGFSAIFLFFLCQVISKFKRVYHDFEAALDTDMMQHIIVDGYYEDFLSAFRECTMRSETALLVLEDYVAIIFQSEVPQIIASLQDPLGRHPQCKYTAQTRVFHFSHFFF